MLRHPLLPLLLIAAVAAADEAAPTASAFTSEAGWVVAPGGTDRVAIALRNPAHAAWSGTLRFELCDADGTVVSTRDQPLDVTADGEATSAAPVDFAGRAIGEHLLRWRLLVGGKDDRRQVAGWERS